MSARYLSKALALAVGTLLTNHAEVTSSSSDPEVASMWAIADVSVIETPPTWHIYLPLMRKD